MRGCFLLSAERRAIVGLIALYALLLQAFLGFAAPARAQDPGLAVLCAEHTAPANGKTDIACHPCCTVLDIGTLAGPIGAFAVSWPFVPSTRVLWRHEAAIPTTGPPSFATSARGPPTV